MQLHYDNLYYLFLVPLLIVTVLIAGCYRLPTLRVSSLQCYRAALGGSRRSWRRVWRKFPLCLEAIALAFFLVALIRPQYATKEELYRSRGIEIFLLLDISRSMEAVDLAPTESEQEIRQQLQSPTIKNRLTVAKEEIKRFIHARTQDRIGLIAFSTYAMTLCPLTLDHHFLSRQLDHIEPGVFGDGTEIAGPIASAVAQLRTSPAKRRVALLFTDGENTVNGKLSPLQAAAIAKSLNVIIYPIAIGSKFAFLAENGLFQQKAWALTQGSFNEVLLKEIAAVTDGRYFKAEDAGGLKAVLPAIDQLETVTLESSSHINYTDVYSRWIILGLFCLCSAFVLEHSPLLPVP